MYHFELRKIATQPLREPWRNLPERKTVMESDEKLHEKYLPQRHRDTEDFLFQ